MPGQPQTRAWNGDRVPLRWWLSAAQTSLIMVYMLSENTATESATRDTASILHGRRKELPNDPSAFTPEPAPKWDASLNAAFVALAAAVVLAPQLLLHPTALIAVPAATYCLTAVASRNIAHGLNASRIRRWARKTHQLQLTRADARELLAGRSAAAHQAVRHGNHLHIHPMPEQAAPPTPPADDETPSQGAALQLGPVPAVG